MLPETYLARPLAKGYFQCLACEHFCAIAPGAAGKCGVRRNLDGAIRLVVYGRAAAAHIDPVEKKPLFHFLPGRPIFSVGTLGCNFFCRFCQNWQISQSRDFDPQSSYAGQELMPDQIVTLCNSQGISMIAFTYNEPTVCFEYAYDTVKLAHEAGLRTVFVSSGFESLAALNMIEPYLDAINVDLKAFRPEFYRTVCGTRLEPVKRNIQHLAQDTRIWIEITTLLIPGLNDSDAELEEMATWLASVDPDMPWHVSAFHPDYQMLDRPVTSPASLTRAARIGRKAGLRYVYVGNVGDPKGESTWCPGCGTLLIRRLWYDVDILWQEPGVCHRCGEHLAGEWR